ncbi:adenylyl-sulfate kinase [Blochmannia endosymbiont of Camponotus sp. C-003]|uniref:adenylyl-sulfate kinase n=1 Tax=unclassified Candidatus Blochmanniella TaxID=711328 RepID=UPI00202501AD|nr:MULTISPECIES: adenylyl-sulfate kinase [unclassified Candidatus Blochmannia]URJ23080.1 adenylyl-sulfate kinase [Blochmannia endosymbiont of Camponotus sp. C-003]URJ28547.1 adenylyl-sulfate kinase [Blochmannia endosymbiont of Camponotus sp. C-046]
MTHKNNHHISNKNIFWNTGYITQKDREFLHKHHAMLLWFTGLSGAGKSVLANILEKKLHYRNVSTYMLDGDNVRYGLCRDLRFRDHDRHENIRRSGETARLMVDAGIVVLATFISPYACDRQMVRSMFPTNNFVEIFVDTPFHICEQRDTKGLYKKARSGEIESFTGISSAYERPKKPDIYLDGQKSITELIDQILQSSCIEYLFTIDLSNNR